MAPGDAADLVARHPGSVAVSAITGAGIDELLLAIGDRLRAITAPAEFRVPYERGDVLAALHREGEVVSTVDDGDALIVRARLSAASAGRINEQLGLSATG
ncbi:MAG: hypothetical protein R2705_08020 [Ilumatobacteraceae bacterium]